MKTREKLNPDKVRDIRKRVRGGESQADVARSYNITPPAVHYIMRGVTWAWVQDQDD